MSLHFPAEFFCSNRNKLCSGLDKDSLILIPAAKNVFQSAGLPYHFTQNPSFFYFSGICEPDCLLLLIPYSPIGKKEIIFIPKPTKQKKMWFGETIDKETVSKISGIAEVEYLENFDAILQAQQNWKTKLYIENNNLQNKTALQFFSHTLQKIKQKNPALEIKKLDAKIATLRNKKHPLEIAAIQKAIDITHQTLLRVWQDTPDANNECQLAAKLTYHYQMLGAAGHAFLPIVAGGSNAITLHYQKNNTALNKKELLLIDTGANWQGYNADITRVIPLSKKFTDYQKQCYELVLQMQQMVVESITPQMTWWELYQKAGQIQGKILKKAKFIAKETEHKQLSIHRIGHSLGLEVHDLCDQDLPLTEGTVLTIEPGLYLPKQAIGIRIEDNFLVTKNKVKNLSQKIPKSIEEIENIF